MIKDSTRWSDLQYRISASTRPKQTEPPPKPNHATISNHRRRRRRRRGSRGKRRRRRRRSSSSRKKAHHLATNPRKPPSTPLPPPPQLTTHPTPSSSPSPHPRTPSPPPPRQPSSPPSAPPAFSTSPTTPSPPPSSPASSPSQPNSSRSLNAAKTRWRGRPRARIADTCAWGGRRWARRWRARRWRGSGRARGRIWRRVLRLGGRGGSGVRIGGLRRRRRRRRRRRQGRGRKAGLMLGGSGRRCRSFSSGGRSCTGLWCAGLRWRWGWRPGSLTGSSGRGITRCGCCITRRCRSGRSRKGGCGRGRTATTVLWRCCSRTRAGACRWRIRAGKKGGWTWGRGKGAWWWTRGICWRGGVTGWCGVRSIWLWSRRWWAGVVVVVVPPTGTWFRRGTRWRISVTPISIGGLRRCRGRMGGRGGGRGGRGSIVGSIWSKGWVQRIEVAESWRFSRFMDRWWGA